MEPNDYFEQPQPVDDFVDEPEPINITTDNSKVELDQPSSIVERPSQSYHLPEDTN